MTRGAVVSIHIGAKGDQPLTSVDAVEAIGGRGLAGDRYCDGTGTWSNYPDPSGKQVTLVEAEVVSELVACGLIMGSASTRRNVVTRSVELGSLIGHRFRIGSAILYGVRTAEPCKYLETRTAPGFCEALSGRGGLRADVMIGGFIGVGDAIAVIARSR